MQRNARNLFILTAAIGSMVPSMHSCTQGFDSCVETRTCPPRADSGFAGAATGGLPPGLGTGGLPTNLAGTGATNAAALGGAGAEPPDTCMPDSRYCEGGAVVVCNGAGSAILSRTACEVTESCFNGACEKHQCLPQSKFCSVGVVRECAPDGLSSAEVEACGAGKYCDQVSASCKTGTCAPGQPACDGIRATTCNAQGSGYIDGGANCGASSTCSAGECKPHVCEPSAKTCSGLSVLKCATDGLSSSVSQTCSASQYCDVPTITCKDQVCSPSSVVCDGRSVKTCDASGSASFTVACGGGTPYCAAGACSPCEPNALRCNAQQPQKCNATGAWANDGATCTGEKVCDAAGSLTCSAAPTVPGGTFNRRNDATKSATVSEFRLDRYEVTVGRFRSFVTAVLGGWRPANGGGKHNHLAAGQGLALAGNAFEAGWNAGWNAELNKADLAAWTSELSCHGSLATWTSAAGVNESRPINCPNWHQAYAFCIWDGGFLPSEAEWNFAAAGGSEQRLYPWGPTAPSNDSSLAVHNCSYMGLSSCGGVQVIAPAGSVAAGNAKWGQADMAGNIAEWTLDGGGPAACVDCASLYSVDPAIRGGYFGSTSASDLATSAASSGPRDLNNPSIGLRCARVP